jgi:hypothetical protein
MMKSNLIVALALLGMLASSACSRSAGSPPPIEQKPAPAATPVPKSQSELDTDSGKSAQDSKTAPSGPQVSNDENDPRSAPRKSRRSTVPRSAPSKSAPSDGRETGPEVVIYDPTGMTPDQIFDSSARQAPVIIGNESDVANGETGEPLYYSGSGQDDLREQLQTWVTTKTRAERVQRDKEFSKRVLNGRFDVDFSARTAVLDVTIKGATGPRVYRFSGQLSNRLLFSSGDLYKGNKLMVEAACMDLNGGCSTVYAKVQDATGGIVRTAHMIIRQTEATLFTHAQGFGVANNPEFDALLETMVRTDHHAGELNALNSLKLRTSETINGQASFRVEMGIRSAFNAQETLNLGGPLVKPLVDFALETKGQVLRSTSPAADTIRQVLMVRNDGRGNLTLAVTVRKATATAQEDTMTLTFSRIHKPVRPLIIK